MACAHRGVRLVVAGAIALACASDAGDGVLGSPRIDDVAPAFADFRHAVSVSITGDGFAAGTRVLFGDAEAQVVTQRRDRLEVRLPAHGRGGRVPVTVRSGTDAITWDHRFVFRGMAPEDLLFVATNAPVEGPAERLAAADLDGDGLLDLVAGAGGSERWLQGTGSLRFDASAAFEGRVLAVVPDRDRDSLLVARGEALELARWTGEALETKAIAGVTKVALAAVDGSIARVTGTAPDGRRALFELATGADGLEAIESYELEGFDVASLAVGDLDADGAADVLLGGRSSGPRLLVGDGNGAFREAAAGTFAASAPGSARVADIDADGLLDVVVTDAGRERVFLRSHGRFVERTDATLGASPRATVAFVDLDADGAVDRVSGSSGLHVERNDGAGRFFDYTSRAAFAVRTLRPLGAADLDGDADVDLVALDASGRLHVLENWAPKAGDDPDHDGIPSVRDVCPGVSDPAQLDRDAFAFACADDADCRARTGCGLALREGGHAWLVCAQAATFDEAAAFCRGRGARLARPHSSEEGTALGTALGRGWIDLSDRAHEGEFRDSLDAQPEYSAWAGGEPNNAAGGEHCAEIRSNGEWNDVPCDLRFAFACEEREARAPDGFGDACDVCPGVLDPGQEDADDDGTGDACEAPP